MGFDWQNLAALGLVTAAALYLVRVVSQSLSKRKAAACGGCSSCAAGEGEAAPQVFEIGTGHQDANRKASAS
jgi:hypothetical protein